MTPKKPKKPKKEVKPLPLRYVVKEISTNKIIVAFPPTKEGERRANKYRGLCDLEIITEY